jgi:hypothetical protein
MASRWVDSGIDWANLNLHKERTSWVIDELYRAFKERESMLNYYTDKESSVLSWDLDGSMRDANKVDEIMIGLQTWLNSLTNNYSRFFDTTIDPNGQAITSGFLNGLPYFDSVALGTLETLVGVSLEQIRNWDVTQVRINSDLLKMIYLVLIELSDIITINRNNPFQPPRPTQNLWDGTVEKWNGAGANYATSIADYNADTGTIITGEYPSADLINGGSYTIRHENTTMVEVSFKDSSNNAITPADLSVKGYKYTEKTFGSSAEFPFLTYDEFTLSSGVLGEIVIQEIAHPIAFTDETGNPQQTARTLIYPIVNIDDVDAILYYT